MQRQPGVVAVYFAASFASLASTECRQFNARRGSYLDPYQDLLSVHGQQTYLDRALCKHIRNCFRSETERKKGHASHRPTCSSMLLSRRPQALLSCDDVFTDGFMCNLIVHITPTARGNRVGRRPGIKEWGPLRLRANGDSWRDRPVTSADNCIWRPLLCTEPHRDADAPPCNAM
jgi:hypothetical protein